MLFLRLLVLPELFSGFLKSTKNNFYNRLPFYESVFMSLVSQDTALSEIHAIVFDLILCENSEFRFYVRNEPAQLGSSEVS